MGVSKASKAATREQVAGVRRLVREQVAAVEHLEGSAMRPVLEVLARAREELRADLKRWIATVKNPEEQFTGYQMKVMLRSLEGTIEALGIRMSDMLENRPLRARAAERAMLDGLRKGTHATGALSANGLETEVVRLGHIFGMSLVGPQIDQAIVIARGDRLLFKSKAIPSSAARYGKSVADDLRFQLSVGVARGETFEQLTQRLRRIGGPTGPVAVRGIMGHPGAIIEDIPEGLFRRYRHFAERMVRTEMMNAYNVQHREGIRVLNEERAEGSPEWLRRWDASADARVCSVCQFLDGQIARIGGMFLQGYDHPPAHPNAVFAGSTFVPYGGLEEIVHARYRGRAIHVRAGDKSTTIGPNHPMLSARGMVKSAELREGDYLLYDLRSDPTWAGRRAGESDLEKIPLVEHVIPALLATGAHVGISTAGHDLHGDVIACEGEVQVIHPADYLLPVWDSGGVEQLREPPFMRPDSEPTLVSRVRPRDLSGVGVDLPPPSGVSGSDARVRADMHFVWLLVSSVSEGWFVGDAFDATTPTSLYCSDGFVVSNCRCVELAWLASWPRIGDISSDVKDAAERSAPPSGEPPAERKNPKRTEAARKAGEASQERRREIYSAVRSNLPEDLHVAWDEEGNKFMRREAGRIKDEKDNISAASKMSEAFTEQYGAGHETSRGYEGDRFQKRAEIEAKHAESWANEQERKYYEAARAAALRDGEINEHGELTARGQAKQAEHDEWAPPRKKSSDDDPPF